MFDKYFTKGTNLQFLRKDGKMIKEQILGCVKEHYDEAMKISSLNISHLNKRKQFYKNRRVEQLGGKNLPIDHSSL